MRTLNRNYYLIKLLLIVIILVFSHPVITSAQKGVVNFSGSWVVNESRSTITNGPRMGGGDFIARQEGNTLTVIRSFTNRNGEKINSIMRYDLGGKETFNTLNRGDSRSVASWSADGKTLTIKTARNFNMGGGSRTLNSVELWTLSDPETVTIKTTTLSRDGDRTITMVYDKK